MKTDRDAKVILTLIAISKQLQQAREEQQKTIAEMHCLTGLSPKALQGLERGDFEVVETVFMRMGLRYLR